MDAMKKQSHDSGHANTHGQAVSESRWPEFCLKLLAHVSTGWATTDGTDSVSIVQAPARVGTKVNGAEFSHAGSSPEAKWLQGRRKCACIGVTVESPTYQSV
jgi:hypothetical protein